MPARRTPPNLKLLAEGAAKRDPVARDAQLAGLGLEWTEVPEVLDETARAEWNRLAEVFAGDPCRFREGDRAALVAYCVYWSAFVTAAAALGRDGPVVAGRSSKDRDRSVKHPATVVLREAATQLRYWCRELALTPDARGRAGITDAGPTAEDPDNPFAG